MTNMNSNVSFKLFSLSLTEPDAKPCHSNHYINHYMRMVNRNDIMSILKEDASFNLFIIIAGVTFLGKGYKSLKQSFFI